ncbi:GH22275 [Drosophila grimshawi]|uniref:GH22275 n=1 Tax=Drosophila grimshawi TaxID=7222 RepID=B4JZ32_DROGR|nr:GH22275 [Drosophila grimshawi]
MSRRTNSANGDQDTGKLVSDFMNSVERDGVITVKAPAFGDNRKSTLIDMGIVPVGIVFNDDADLVKLELKAERLQEQSKEDLKCEQHSVKTFTPLSSGKIRQMHGITVDRERERRVPDRHQVDANTAMRSAKNHEYYKKSLEEHSKQDHQLTGAAEATTADTEQAMQPMEVDADAPLLTINCCCSKLRSEPYQNEQVSSAEWSRYCRSSCNCNWKSSWSNHNTRSNNNNSSER